MQVRRTFIVEPGRLLSVLVLIAVILPGCAISQITSPFRSRSERAGWAATVSEDRLLEAAKNDTSSRIDMPSRDRKCPRIMVWQRDRMLNIYEEGRIGDALGVRHRGEITKTARECKFFRDKVIVKYGFAGRVLLGQRGQPGVVTLPIRVHITDSARNIISSEAMSVSANIPPGTLVGYFSAVREAIVALPSGMKPSQFNFFIAFDRNAPGAG